MKRDKERKARRAEYVQGKISEAASQGVKIEYAVTQLADSLFLSKSTIYNDLRVTKSLKASA